MKKFIFKLLPFVLPFLIFFICNLYFGVRNQGDLLRIGYLINTQKNYRAIFNDDYSSDTIYCDFSKHDNKKYTALTIGDSFSQQGNIGYQSFLASYDSTSILHFNESGNSIEILHGIINGNILDSIRFDYIIIQSVERHFVERATHIDSTQTIDYNQIMKRDEWAKQNMIREKSFRERPPRFFSESTIKFPLNNMSYLIKDKPFLSRVYKVKINEKSFSTGGETLLFYEDDINSICSNNNLDKIRKSNRQLNTLSKKLKTRGIELIVLISPDKYDMYYDEIEQIDKYPRPLFFNYMDTFAKDYIYINSKKILNEAKQDKIDVYFYDDTHWSPLASEIIATEINKKIRTHNKT